MGGGGGTVTSCEGFSGLAEGSGGAFAPEDSRGAISARVTFVVAQTGQSSSPAPAC